MDVMKISPRSGIDAVVEMPASKSYMIRALEISALANGPSELENVSWCDDSEIMADALRKLGVDIEAYKDKLRVTPPEILKYSGELYVADAGMATRSLTGFCSLVDGTVRLHGTQRAHERPIGDLVDAMNNLIDGSAEAKSVNKKGDRCPPVVVKSRGLIGGKTKLKGDTSSQYLSSILMVSPRARNDVDIEIVGDLTSKPYADMTIDVMRQFGAHAENREYKNFFVRAGQNYVGRHYTIECDASNASYFLAAAAITGGIVRVKNINPNSVQGDIHFADVLERMGCAVRKGVDYIEVKGPEKLRALEINMNSMPDMAPTIAVLAAIADGTTAIYGIGNLREKETDRINALQTELGKTGIRTQSTTDSLIVYGGMPHGAEIETYDDHRMAMSFSVLGLNVLGIRVGNPACTSKSHPNYWKDFGKL